MSNQQAFLDDFLDRVRKQQENQARLNTMSDEERAEL